MKWFIFLLLAFAIGNTLFGIAEYSYLGAYADQGVWAPFFNTFSVDNTDGVFTKVSTLILSSETYSSIWQMFTWNYAVLNEGLGSWVRYVILMPLSAAFAFTLILTLFQSLPIVGRGS